MGEEESLTPEEREELSKLMGTAPVPDEKHNVHTFISKVLTTKDTTKVGNLREEEIGTLKQHVRGYKEEEIWAREIIRNESLAKILASQAEIATSTSLSRGAALLRFATTTSRTIADLTKKERAPNSGMFGFGKKNNDEPGFSTTKP